MSDKIKVGDRVHVSVEYDGIVCVEYDGIVCVLDGDEACVEDDDGIHCTHVLSKLTRIEPEPVTLRPKYKEARMPAAIDAQTAKARAMSEGELFNEVATLLKRLGWRYHHVPATAYRKNHIPAGFPDITAVKGGRLIFAELKRERESLSDEQDDWGQALTCVAEGNQWVEYHIWRPSDLLAGRIDRVLAE